MPSRAYRNSKEHSETFPFLPLSLSYPFPISPFPPPHFLLPAPLPVPPPLFLPLSLSPVLSPFLLPLSLFPVLLPLLLPFFLFPVFLPLLLPEVSTLLFSSGHSENSPRGGRKSNPLIVSGLHLYESRGETKLVSPRNQINSNVLNIR